VTTEPLPTPEPISPPAPVKPRLRGVVHAHAFFVALAAGALLVVLAPSGHARVPALIYAATLCGLLGTSALYHRVDWRTVRARMWMRRADHSMIFLLVAGTYTPFAVLVLHGGLATTILVVVWAGALGGVILSLAWPGAPRAVTAAVYLALGWVAVVAMPQILDQAGWAALILLGAGGVLYTAGAVIYALRRPDPSPLVFGYHEVFHVLVVIAAAAHYAAVAGWAVSAGS
jgi:hemolysin III